MEAVPHQAEVCDDRAGALAISTTLANMKPEYDLSKLRSRSNPYAAKLKKQPTTVAV